MSSADNDVFPLVDEKLAVLGVVGPLARTLKGFVYNQIEDAIRKLVTTKLIVAYDNLIRTIQDLMPGCGTLLEKGGSKTPFEDSQPEDEYGWVTKAGGWDAEAAARRNAGGGPGSPMAVANQIVSPAIQAELKAIAGADPDALASQLTDAATAEAGQLADIATAEAEQLTDAASAEAGQLSDVAADAAMDAGQQAGAEVDAAASSVATTGAAQQTGAGVQSELTVRPVAVAEEGGLEAGLNIRVTLQAYFAGALAQKDQWFKEMEPTIKSAMPAKTEVTMESLAWVTTQGSDAAKSTKQAQKKLAKIKVPTQDFHVRGLQNALSSILPLVNHVGGQAKHRVDELGLLAGDALKEGLNLGDLRRALSQVMQELVMDKVQHDIFPLLDKAVKDIALEQDLPNIITKKVTRCVFDIAEDFARKEVNTQVVAFVATVGAALVIPGLAAANATKDKVAEDEFGFAKGDYQKHRKERPRGGVVDLVNSVLDPEHERIEKLAEECDSFLKTYRATAMTPHKEWKQTKGRVLLGDAKGDWRKLREIHVDYAAWQKQGYKAALAEVKAECETLGGDAAERAATANTSAVQHTSALRRELDQMSQMVCVDLLHKKFFPKLDADVASRDLPRAQEIKIAKLVEDGAESILRKTVHKYVVNYCTDVDAEMYVDGTTRKPEEGEEEIEDEYGFLISAGGFAGVAAASGDEEDKQLAKLHTEADQHARNVCENLHLHQGAAAMARYIIVESMEMYTQTAENAQEKWLLEAEASEDVKTSTLHLPIAQFHKEGFVAAINKLSPKMAKLSDQSTKRAEEALKRLTEPQHVTDLRRELSQMLQQYAMDQIEVETFGDVDAAVEALQLEYTGGKRKRMVGEVKLAAYHIIDDTARLAIHQAVVAAYTETETSLHAEKEGTAAVDLTVKEQAEDQYGFVKKDGGYAKFRDAEVLGMAALAGKRGSKAKRKRKQADDDVDVDDDESTLSAGSSVAEEANPMVDEEENEQAEANVSAGLWPNGSVLTALHDQPVRKSSMKDAQGLWILKAGVKVRVEQSAATQHGNRLLVKMVPPGEQAGPMAQKLAKKNKKSGWVQVEVDGGGGVSEQMLAAEVELDGDMALELAERLKGGLRASVSPDRAAFHRVPPGSIVHVPNGLRLADRIKGEGADQQVEPEPEPEAEPEDEEEFEREAIVMELTPEDEAIMAADIEGVDEGVLSAERANSASVKKFKYIAEALREKAEMKPSSAGSMKALKAKDFFTETLEDLTYSRVALALEPHLVETIETVRYWPPKSDVDVSLSRTMQNLLQTATDNLVEGKVREEIQRLAGAAYTAAATAFQNSIPGIPHRAGDASGDEKLLEEEQEDDDVELPTEAMYIVMSKKALQKELKKRQLDTKGSKEDMAKRLVQADADLQADAEAAKAAAEEAAADAEAAAEAAALALMSPAELLLRQVPLMDGLLPETRTTLAKAMVSKSFVAGEVIMKEGDEGDRMYIVESGEADVSVEGMGVVAVKKSGDWFGEIALIHRSKRTASVVAKGQCVCFELRRDDFSAQWVLSVGGGVSAVFGLTRPDGSPLLGLDHSQDNQTVSKEDPQMEEELTKPEVRERVRVELKRLADEKISLGEKPRKDPADIDDDWIDDRFDRFDVDLSGTIDLFEWERLLQSLEHPEIKSQYRLEGEGAGTILEVVDEDTVMMIVYSLRYIEPLIARYDEVAHARQVAWYATYGRGQLGKGRSPFSLAKGIASGAMGKAKKLEELIGIPIYDFQKAGLLAARELMLENMKQAGGDLKKLAGKLAKEKPDEELVGSAVRDSVQEQMVRYAVQLADDVISPVIEKRLNEVGPTSVAGTPGKPLFSKKEIKALRTEIDERKEALLQKEVNLLLRSAYNELREGLEIPGTVMILEPGDGEAEREATAAGKAVAITAPEVEPPTKGKRGRKKNRDKGAAGTTDNPLALRSFESEANAEATSPSFESEGGTGMTAPSFESEGGTGMTSPLRATFDQERGDGTESPGRATFDLEDAGGATSPTTRSSHAVFDAES